MNKYQLGVAVKDPEYLKRLADYIRDSKLGEQWQVVAFTNAEACRRYVQQGYKMDVLAAQPELLSGLKAELPKMPVIALVLKLGESGEEHELHQYQPLPQLLQRLSEIHARAAVHASARQMAIDEETSAGVRVISVYSASGGTGKTALALHLAHAAGAHRRRTFYLNLERWNSSAAWLGTLQNGDGDPIGEAKEEGLSELLYSLKAQPEQAVQWIMEHRKRDTQLKGDYLAVCTNLEDRLTLCEEDAQGLIDAISRSGQYDVIIVDLDSDMDGMHVAVFEKSDQVLWVMNGNASVKNKQKMARSYGEQKWNGRFKGLARKFIDVNNQAARVGQTALQGETDRMNHAAFQLPEIPEWRGAGSVKLLSSPLYRAAADQLFKQLIPEGVGMVAE